MSAPQQLPPDLPKTRVAQCRQCGCGVIIEATYVDGILFPPQALLDCDRCEGRINETLQAARRKEAGRRSIRWFLHQIGEHYAAAKSAQVCEELRPALDWRPAPPQCGLMILGPARRGKTSAAVLLAARLIRNDGGEPREAEAINGVEFKQLTIDVYHDDLPRKRAAEERLALLASVGLLFIDDIDKCKFTQETFARLWQVIEARTAHQRPFLITGNSDAVDLSAMFTNAGVTMEGAKSLVGRLGEFCEVVTVA